MIDEVSDARYRAMLELHDTAAKARGLRFTHCKPRA
jgi:hypothetical protein